MRIATPVKRLIPLLLLAGLLPTADAALPRAETDMIDYQAEQSPAAQVGNVSECENDRTVPQGSSPQATGSRSRPHGATAPLRRPFVNVPALYRHSADQWPMRPGPLPGGMWI